MVAPDLLGEALDQRLERVPGDDVRARRTLCRRRRLRVRPGFLPGPGPEDLGQLERRRLLELVVAAVGRLLVRGASA